MYRDRASYVIAGCNKSLQLCPSRSVSVRILGVLFLCSTRELQFDRRPSMETSLPAMRRFAFLFIWFC